MALTWVRNLGWLTRHDLAQEVGGLMATVEQFQAAITAINDATNAVAAEVARLREIIAGGGLDSGQETDVLLALQTIETRLRAIASEPVEG